jgi:hypothetical protein
VALNDRVRSVAEDSDFYEKTFSTVRSGVQTRVRSETYDEGDRYRDEVIAAEGAETFEAFQDFLDVAVSLAAERRLSRWVFHARKASGPAP